tara:strand:+ start:2524 stop:3336 length:813 start_codon:yes stop_codon:yes gene_type:complete
MNTLLGYSYQDGGEVSPSYQRNFGFSGGTSPTLAALLRKREKYRAQEEYEDAMREEAKKRESASSWGGFGSLLGSLLLPALTGATGGLWLPLMAGLGSGLGKKMGASSGYQGKLDLNPLNAAESEDYSSVMEDEDLIYGKDAFEDMSKSSRDYARRGIDQDAIVSGLTSAALAGFGGDDSIYAKAGSTDLLEEGARGRIKDLFKAQAMPTKVEPWSMGKSDFIARAEQGDYGEFTKFKNTFGLNDYRRNLLDYMNIGTIQPFDITKPIKY